MFSRRIFPEDEIRALENFQRKTNSLPEFLFCFLTSCRANHAEHFLTWNLDDRRLSGTLL
jgi:hypothetical protein